MRSIEWICGWTMEACTLFVKLNEGPPGGKGAFLCSVLTSERVGSGLRATKHESTLCTVLRESRRRRRGGEHAERQRVTRVCCVSVSSDLCVYLYPRITLYVILPPKRFPGCLPPYPTLSSPSEASVTAIQALASDTANPLGIRAPQVPRRRPAPRPRPAPLRLRTRTPDTQCPMPCRNDQLPHRKHRGRADAHPNHDLLYGVLAATARLRPGFSVDRDNRADRRCGLAFSEERSALGGSPRSSRSFPQAQHASSPSDQSFGPGVTHV